MRYILYIISGVLFGILMLKSEAVSWFRIQEMFRFQSFHMYGIIGSAVITGFLSLRLLKWAKIKNLKGDLIKTTPKSSYVISPLLGGVIFGIGWAMTGACPGPLFVNFGAGYTVMAVVIGFAVLGAFVHGIVRKKLPL